MPDIMIKYDGDEVRALIQADMKERFGVEPNDDDLTPDFNDSGSWSVTVDKGTLDAAKARHVAES